MQTYVLLNEHGQIIRRVQQPEDWPREEGFVLEDGQPYAPDPIRDFEAAMASARSAMAAILDSQTLADRMILQTLRVDIEHALNLGQVDMALYTIVNAEIPAELEPVRAQILALFPQG